MIEALQLVLGGEGLTREKAADVMERIVTGQVAPEQIGALLAALQFKSESVEEIVGFVQALKKHAVLVPAPFEGLIDICGTGGDGSGTFNVSTTVAFVVAAAGQPVAKHGNRSVSSRSGSFDVLEALGVPFVLEAGDAEKSLRDFGLAFLFAPIFHPVMKSVGPLRKSLGIRTVFNILGPLLNPVGVRRQLIGVYSPLLLEKVARVLQELGAEEAMVVRGEDGIDEFSLEASTQVVHLKSGRLTSFRLAPEDVGLKRAPRAAVLGGDAQDNARILLQILAGERGAPRDLVLLNAAAALVTGNRAADMRDGVRIAASAIDSGQALDLLQRMRGSR